MVKLIDSTKVTRSTKDPRTRGLEWAEKKGGGMKSKGYFKMRNK